MKTIIVYTSKYGCTEKAAYELKSRLSGETEVVNLMHAKEPSLAPYDTVILGGSIYFGKIQKEMSDFANKYQQELLAKRVGLFICAGMKGEQVAQELTAAYPVDVYNRALAKETFGDEVYVEKLSLLDKFILRMVKGKKHEASGLSTKTIESFAEIMSIKVG